MIPTLTHPYPFHPGGVHTIFAKPDLLHGSSLTEAIFQSFRWYANRLAGQVR